MMAMGVMMVLKEAMTMMSVMMMMMMMMMNRSLTLEGCNQSQD